MAAIRGIVDKVLKAGDGPNGRSFAVVSYEKDDGTISEVRLGGKLGSLSEGDSFSAEGQWSKKDYRGKTQYIFNAKSMRPDFPKTKKGVTAWLNGILPMKRTGLSQRAIEDVVENAEDIDRLIKQPDELVKASSNPEYHEEAIRRIIEYRSSAKRATDMMRSAKLDNPSINRVLSAFKNETYQTLQNNPYDIMIVPSVDFEKADRLGSHMGVSKKDHRRVVAAVWDFINKAENVGSSCVPLAEVIENVSNRFSLPDEEVRDIMMSKISSQDTDKFYALQVPGQNGIFVMSETSYRSEVSAASALLDIVENNRRNDPERVEAAAKKVLEGTVLDEHQRNAVRVAATHPISIITGGPGTGKSTILEKMIEVSKLVENANVIVTAPTGKAAKRAEEVTGEPGQTLQMLLGQFYNERSGRNEFRVNRQNPLPDNTVVVVDEVSMMDNELLAALFAAMPQTGRIVLQGDKNQLPSVGVGRVLADLMEANIKGQNVLPTAHLVNVYRQDKESRISKVAEMMNEGRVPELDGGLRGGVMFKECSSRKIADEVLDLVRHQFVAKGIDPTRDVAIITPQAPGYGGTWEINKALSNELNPDGESIPGITRGKYDDERMPLPRVGDRVMLTENDHDNEVMNGDVGFIRGFEPDEKRPNASTITVEYDDGKTVDMPSSKWRDLMLAYAITCHKSQGSQYPIVVMPFSEMHERMAERSLVYTGWTRAKKMVIGLGSKDTFAKFVETNKSSQRFTILRSMFEYLAERRDVRPLGERSEYLPLPKPPKLDTGVTKTVKTPEKPATSAATRPKMKLNLTKKAPASESAEEPAAPKRKKVMLSKSVVRKANATKPSAEPEKEAAETSEPQRTEEPAEPKPSQPASRKVRPRVGSLYKKPRVKEEEPAETQPSMKF